MTDIIDNDASRQNKEAKERADVETIVSFVRAKLPDIGANDEDQSVSSNIDVFKKALVRLEIDISKETLLGYQPEKSQFGDEVSAYFLTDNPKILVAISKVIKDDKEIANLFAICIMGENKVRGLKAKLKSTLPGNEDLSVLTLK